MLVFIQVFILWSLNFIAVEIENPFGTDANDLDGKGMQTEFNRQLLMLLQVRTTETPILYFDEAWLVSERLDTGEYKSLSFLEVWGVIDDKEVAWTARKDHDFTRAEMHKRNLGGSRKEDSSKRKFLSTGGENPEYRGSVLSSRDSTSSRNSMYAMNRISSHKAHPVNSSGSHNVQPVNSYNAQSVGGEDKSATNTDYARMRMARGMEARRYDDNVEKIQRFPPEDFASASRGDSKHSGIETSRSGIETSRSMEGSQSLHLMPIVPMPLGVSSGLNQPAPPIPPGSAPPLGGEYAEN
jgi:hypothetical protein